MTKTESIGNGENRKFVLSDGLLLGVMPVFVYGMGYSYESGYVSFFGVPTSLISIDAPAMVSAALFGAMYAFVLLLWITSSVDSSASNSYVGKSIGLIMMYFGFFVVLYFMIKGTEYLTFTIAALFVVMLLIVLLEKLEGKWVWLRRFFMRIHSKLSESLDYEEKAPVSAADKLREMGAILFIALLPFVLAYIAGKNNAKEQAIFSVISSKIGDLAVVRIYGDRIIGIPFDRKDKEFSKEFVILKSESISERLFKSQKIGPLKDISNMSPIKSNN